MLPCAGEMNAMLAAQMATAASYLNPLAYPMLPMHDMVGVQRCLGPPKQGSSIGVFCLA